MGRPRIGNLQEDEIILRLMRSDQVQVLDVGANVGQSALRFKSIFGDRLTSIVCFEPVPSAFQELSRQITFPEAKLVNIAIGSGQGSVTIHEYAKSSLSSSLLPNNDSLWVKERSLQYGDSIESGLIVQSHVVELQSLDNFVEENRIEAISILKIDTQGSEEQVLAGAKNLLSDKILRPDVVLVEVILGNGYEKPQTFLDIERFLVPAGFRAVSLSSGGDLFSSPSFQVDILYAHVEVIRACPDLDWPE